MQGGVGPSEIPKITPKFTPKHWQDKYYPGKRRTKSSCLTCSYRMVHNMVCSQHHMVPFWHMGHILHLWMLVWRSRRGQNGLESSEYRFKVQGLYDGVSQT